MICQELDTDDISVLKNQLAEKLKELKLSENCIITKVNWGNKAKGYFSDYQVLDLYFESIRKNYPSAKLIVLESYSYERNDPVLIHYRPYYYRKRINIIKSNEQKFLKENNFISLFEKYNVEYINATEEFENKRVVKSSIIKKILNEKYKAKVTHKELLKMVPLKLQNYFDSSLVSFTKIKGWFSEGSNFYTASMKNLFGLIPLPCRRCYHGKSNKGLGSAICDINLIYRSLFREVGIAEAVFKTKLFLKEKAIVVENMYCIAISDNLAYLDCCIIKSLHGNPFIHNYINTCLKYFPINENIEIFPRIERKFIEFLNPFSEI